MDPTFDASLTRDDVGRGCFAIDLDGHIQSYVPSIRDRLIERGVLRKHADDVWHIHWHGFDLEKEKASDMSCCDFCSARPVTWLIPCVDFPMPGPPGAPDAYSRGDWAACATCGSLIAAGERRKLLSHCLTTEQTATFQAMFDIPAGELPPQLRALMRKMKTELHDRFWRHYRSGAVEVTPHPFGH